MSNTTATLDSTKTFTVTTLALTILTFYQKFVSPLLHQLLGVKAACRMTPTCSEFTKNAIMHHGVGKGSLLGLRRIINCQPIFNL